MAEASTDVLEQARKRGGEWGRQVAAVIIPVVGAHVTNPEVLDRALEDALREVERLTLSLVAQQGQEIALAWRTAAITALRNELLAFDALAEAAARRVH